jgi:hypothetical protein
MAVNEKVGIELEVKTGSLKTQLREATQELVRLQSSAGASAKEIAAAAKRAAELKDRIGDARATIEAFDPDAKFKAFGQSIQGVAGAFAATQGALALVGVESKDVEKQLLKVQGALALSEGLNTVLASVDGFKNLGLVLKTNVVAGFAAMRTAAVTAFTTVRGALIATGVGLFAVALGLIIANFDAIKSALLKAIPGLEGFGKIVGDIVEKVTDFVGITNEADRALEKLNKTTSRRKEDIEGQIKILEAAGSSEQKISELRTKLVNVDLNKLREKRRLTGKLTEEELKEYRDLNTELVVIQAKGAKAQKDQQKTIDAEAEKTRQEKFDRELEQNEKRIKRLLELGNAEKTEFQKKLDEYKTQYEADLKLFSDNEEFKLLAKKEYDQKIFDASKAEKERVRQANKEAADKYAEDKIKELDKQKEIQDKNNLKLTNLMDKSIKKRAEDEIKITKLTQDEKLNIVSGAVQMGIKIAGEGSVVGKALAIADATINTYAGASRALKELPPPFSYIAAATTIASGLLNVQQILQTPIPSSAGVSDTSGGGSIGGAPPMTPRPQMTAPTELGATSLNTISNVVSRAYVVESDITTSQQRISRIQNAARF